MPELPEVETVVRGLQKTVIGDTVDDVWLSGRSQPLKSSPAEIAEVLGGARIAGVRRMGKHIVMDLEVARATSPATRRRATAAGGRATPAHFIVHLGMTGKILVVAPDEPLEKHTHFIARLKSGRELRFVDPRMFGKLAVARQPFQTAGSEPLDIGFELFAGLFRKRKTPIKSALLNQKLLRGIGNIYADESLFRAGVRPRRRAASLTRADLHRLYESVQQVLNEAIRAGGSSVSDYVDSAGEPGFFQLEHRVYGRERDPCLVCRTPVKRIVIAGRSSHYCPKCQK
ncbi:MAG: bifunctional DNA-formamidopyrimidine glycosylase/DNA-(apurinic or apyrimidinic site) lyase [Terriglobales bacterium]